MSELPNRQGVAVTAVTLSWYTPFAEESAAEAFAETLKLPLHRSQQADEEGFRGFSWWVYSYVLPTEKGSMSSNGLRLYVDIHKHSHEDRIHWVLTADETPKNEPPDNVPLAGPEVGGLEGFFAKLKQVVKLEHLIDVTSDVTFELNGGVWEPSIGGISMLEAPINVGSQSIPYFGRHWRSDSKEGSIKTMSAFVLPGRDMLISIKATINLRVSDDLLLEASDVAWSVIGSLLCRRK